MIGWNLTVVMLTACTALSKPEHFWHVVTINSSPPPPPPPPPPPNFHEIRIKYKTSHSLNALENVVWEMAAILNRPLYVYIVYLRLWNRNAITSHSFPHVRLATKTPSVHYGDVTMGAIASQITSFAIVNTTVYSDADQRKHQSSASLVFVSGIYRGPVNSPHKWPVTRKKFPTHDVIMVNDGLSIPPLKFFGAWICH